MHVTVSQQACPAPRLLLGLKACASACPASLVCDKLADYWSPVIEFWEQVRRLWARPILPLSGDSRVGQSPWGGRGWAGPVPAGDY